MLGGGKNTFAFYLKSLGKHGLKCSKIMALSDKQIIDALKSNAGFVTETAKALGVTYQAIDRRIKRNDKIAKTYHAIRESHLDFAESKLLTKIKDGELTAITFYLERIGKHRGYVKREEQTGPDGGPLKGALTIKYVDAD